MDHASPPNEIALLDGGAYDGVWHRTGETFVVGSQAADGVSETCRFFSTSFSPKSSHFYTPFAVECAKVKTSPDWQYEGIAFFLQLADAIGVCPAGATPLYRLYNNGMGGAPNHRYTTRRFTVDQMHGQGWTSEGNGPDATFACLPSANGAVTTAEGQWFGTTSSGQTARAIVLDDGTYYIVYSQPGSSVDGGVVQGSSSAADGQFSSNDGWDVPIAEFDETGGRSFRATVSGTYVPRSSLQLTITETTGTRALSATYDTGFERPASLAAAAGTYTGSSGHNSGARFSTFTLTSSGNLSGRNDVCNFAGVITPRNMVNIFNWTVSRTSGGCIFGNGPISGVMYYDEASRQIHGFAPYASRTDQWYLIGTKQ